MIFVDTNVFVYAVGRPHPHREDARTFLLGALERPGPPLVTSSEVLQELLHVYRAGDRLTTYDDAARLVEATTTAVWTVEAEDVALARALADRHAALEARDLLHVACCRRRNITAVKTFDRRLAAAF